MEQLGVTVMEIEVDVDSKWSVTGIASSNSLVVIS